MEGLVREMKDEETGVRVKSQKLFLTSIPSAFAGTYIYIFFLQQASSDIFPVTNKINTEI